MFGLITIFVLQTIDLIYTKIGKPVLSFPHIYYIFTYTGKLLEKLKFVVNQHRLLKTTSTITDRNRRNKAVD